MKQKTIIKNAYLISLFLAMIFLTLPQVCAAREKIVFQSHRDGNEEIYVMDSDGSNQTRLTYGNNTEDSESPSFSPDGSKIVFVNRKASPSLYMMNADGTNQTFLFNYFGHAYQPSFSPDGNKIVFISYGYENPLFDTEIYVINSDGTNLTRLTFNTPDEYNPSFSPDGSKIVFSSHLYPGQITPYTSPNSHGSQIYVMNADGSNLNRLTSNPTQNYYPNFSPDGSKIVFTSYVNSNEAPEIYVMNVDGSNKIRLTYNPTYEIEPVFSPDGSKIAFSDYGYIYIINSDGTNLTRLSNSNSWTGDRRPSFVEQPDTDSDDVPDWKDNCLLDSNTDQLDTDGDGQGNTCDADDDGDGVPDVDDTDDDNDSQSDDDELSCGSDSLDAASLSPDNDSDNTPDCVDLDDDNDGIDDAEDAFPLDPTELYDTDADGTGDNADTDDDNDNQSDEDEIACDSDWLNAESMSADNDLDNIPDCVDPDDDDDGVLDEEDNCPLTANADQTDSDFDGIGDACAP